MSGLAKAYVLGEPFQSHRAADRMTDAINLKYSRLIDENERLRSAIEYAHSEGFEWPADPLPPASETRDCDA